MKPAVVLILGRTEKGNLEELVFGLGFTAVVRERMQDALGKLHHGGFAAMLVDRDHVDVDVLEFVLNVRDIDKHVPIFVVGRGEEKSIDKTLGVLRRTFLVGKWELQKRLAAELENVSSTNESKGD